tara:strand:+ start:4449 stop:4556 length:108 start_codon:yes stop_codon:yes gene_type:complete
MIDKKNGISNELKWSIKIVVFAVLQILTKYKTNYL